MAKKFEIYDFHRIDADQQEPVGSKEKYWLYAEPGREKLLWVAEAPDDSTILYLIKLVRPGDGKRNSIGEDWAEVVAANICWRLKIPHADYDFASWDGQRGVITPKFTSDDESLMHMDEVMELPDEPSIQQRRKRSRIYYTLPKLWEIFTQSDLLLLRKQPKPDGIKTPADMFVGYLMLDALIGNTDRHEQNICLIFRYHKKGMKRFLAPTFDHASSLGRELTDDKRIKLLEDDTQFNKYANKCMSEIYSGEPQSRQLSTIEAFHEVALLNPKAAKIWLDRLKQLREDDVRKLFLRIPDQLITKPAIDFSLRFISKNKEVLLGIRGELK